MKWLFPFLLLANCALAADMCHLLFRKNTHNLYSADLDKIHKINRLEEWSRKMRVLAYKENPTAPSAFRKARQRFGRVESKLLEGDQFEAVFAYQTIFRRVEGAALVIERHAILAKAMRKAQEIDVQNPTEFFLKEGVLKSLAREHGERISRGGDLARELEGVERILRKNYRELGKHFDEYNHVRFHMESLRKDRHCSDSCAEAVDNFFKNAGLPSESARGLLGPLVGNRKAFAFEEIRRLFNAHPEAVLIARKKEFVQEGLAIVKKYVNNFRLVRRLFDSLANSSWGKKRRIVRVFKSIFDRQYMEFHSLAAKRVAYSELDIAEKFALMEEQIKNVDPDFFWMNFSRANEGRLEKVWKELMDYGKSKHPEIHQRMARAQVLGNDVGPVSDQKLKGVFSFIATAALGAGTWAYFTYEPDLEEVAEVSSGQGEDEEPVVLVDYLEELDEEITDTLSVVYEIDREIASTSEQ